MMNSWKWVAAGLVSVVLGTGMQSNAEQRPGAGGPCDTRAYEDAARGRPDVTGIALDCYREPSGDTSMPFDFSKAPLEVYQLAGDTWEPAKVTVLTAKNELRIPPGMFQSGQRYAIAVAASHISPPQDFRTRPFRDYTSAEMAETLSGILTAP